MKQAATTTANEVREPYFRRILVAIDGSESSIKAALLAADLAKKTEAQLTLLHVIQSPGYFDVATPTLSKTTDAVLQNYFNHATAKAESWVEKVAEAAEAKGVVPKREIISGGSSTVEAIINYAEKGNTDLILVGRRGMSTFKHLVIGSISSGVVGHAHCSVLVVQ